MEKLIECCTTDFGSAKEITDEWVASIIDGNFNEFETASVALKPSFFDTDDIVQRDLFKKLRKRLVEIVTQRDSPELWRELAGAGISVKKLMILMWYAVERAIPKTSSQLAVEAGTAAATAYIVLCSIKGSSAFNVFNQFFYEKCFDLFRPVQRSYTFGSREVQQPKQVQQPAKTKGKGKKKAQEFLNETDRHEEEEIDRCVAGDLVEDILRAFFILSGKFALGGYEQPAILTVSFIRDVCVIDRDSRNIHVSPVDTVQEFDDLPSKSDKAFALFHRLADDRHSNGGVLIHSRIVRPRLSFWGTDNAPANTIPASFNTWKDLMVRFLKERIQFNIASELQIILKVLDNIYIYCVDKSDYRLKVSGCIVEILLLLPREYQFEFVQRVDRFARNAKRCIRAFSAEVIPGILRNIDLSGQDPGPLVDLSLRNKKKVADKTIKQEVDESQMEQNEQDSDDEVEAVQRKKKPSKKKKRLEPCETTRVDPLLALYNCIIRYCLDKASSIRSRALIHLASFIKDPEHREGLFKTASDMLETDKWLYKSPARKATASQNGQQPDEAEETNHHDDSEVMPVDNLILFVITRALQDRAAQVRKSGLLALSVYLPNEIPEADFLQLFKLLCDRCLDASILVRKSAAEALSIMLQETEHHHEQFDDAWLEFVLPMINDREQSVQQIASKLIAEYLVTPLIGETKELTWCLLKKIEQQDNHRRLLIRSLFYLNQEKTIDELIVDTLQEKLISDPEMDDVIWMILSQLAVVFTISPKLALKTWYNFAAGDRSNKVRYVAKVLCSATAQLLPAEKRQLVDDLKNKLGNFLIAAPNISTVYLLLGKLYDGVGEMAKGKHELEAFGVVTLKACQKQVKKNLEEFTQELHLEQGESLESMENRLIRVITTIGEIIQFSPNLVKNCEKLVEALKTIMASEDIQHDHVLRERILNSAVPSLQQSLVSTRPPSALNSERFLFGSNMNSQRQSQGAAASSQGNGPIIPAHLIGGQLFTRIVRAYCVLALGKFCLMDYNRAKECVPVFIHQLRVNQDHIIRNNIILVICDLCIRNTQLVDRYSPVIAGCLKDRSTLVRHQTLESLTNLIKEQYIRWEGQIMYRFVSMILDEDANIRKYAEFCLKHVLLKQFPDMFYRHFIECLLYYNDISKNHLTGESEDLDVEQTLKFTLSGKGNKENRMRLYKFMMNTFDDKDKFTIMAHICEKALMPVVSGEFAYKDKKVQAVLADAFDIMSSKEIKLSLDVGKGNEEDEDEPPPAILAAAKKMISEAFRKGIIQTIMPHLLEVRAFLQEKRSPLLKNCLIVLRNICIDHKEQIEEVLAGDKQLQAEIEYDIRKFEEQQANEQRRARQMAEEAAKRNRRSLAAAAIIMSAVKTKNTGKRMLRRDDEAERLQPIKMEIEENSEQNSRSLDLGVAEKEPVSAEEEQRDEEMAGPAEKSEQAMPMVEIKTEPISRNNSVVGDEEQAAEEEDEEEEEEVQQPNKKADKSRAGSSSSRNTSESKASSKQNTSRRSVSQEKTKKTSTACRKTRSPSPSSAEKENSFLEPPSPKPRKRTREGSVTDPNETAVPTRAISTPNKTINDLTFANLDLSAIPSDSNVTQRRRTASRRLTGKPPSMHAIEED